jgi:hypothetical protein
MRLFVPQLQLDASQTRQKRKALSDLQFWVGSVALAKRVIGDSAVEVVDVVEAYVGRDPR